MNSNHVLMAMVVVWGSIQLSLAKPFHTRSEHVRRHRARRSLSQGNSHRTIFTELWGVDTEWSQSLGNPCASQPSRLSNAQELNALDIDGRQREINLLSGAMSSQLRAMESQMSLGECMGQSIQNMPHLPTSEEYSPAGNFSIDVLTKIYHSFYFISSHFRIMHRDWAHGKSCGRSREVIVPKLLRLARIFRDGMCALLNPIDPQIAPYPSDELLEEHEKALNRAIYHYHDCSGRHNRDCIVLSYAKTLSEAVHANTK